MLWVHYLLKKEMKGYGIIWLLLRSFILLYFLLSVSRRCEWVFWLITFALYAAVHMHFWAFILVSGPSEAYGRGLGCCLKTKRGWMPTGTKPWLGVFNLRGDAAHYEFCQPRVKYNDFVQLFCSGEWYCFLMVRIHYMTVLTQCDLRTHSWTS